MITTTIIVGIVALIAGGVLTYILVQIQLRGRSNNIIKEAMAEADVIKKEKILQAKEKFLQLKLEHEKQINSKNSKIQSAENRIKQKETFLAQKNDEVNRKKEEAEAIKENLDMQIDLVDRKSEELDKSIGKQREQLEAISGLSSDEAKEQFHITERRGRVRGNILH